jgi:TolB-like protein/Tfp pilus assembly protein PilF
MALVDPSASQKPLEPPSAERLDSWKEIAAYLKRDESTVRRWEEEGLPVHRYPHKKKASVFAYRAEIDRWVNNGHAGLATTAVPAATTERRTAVWWTATALGLLVLAALGLNVLGVRDRLLARSVAGHITSIAVLPLKNLSGDPGQDYFADGMTEALITRLGQISALHVISHQSMLGYRDTTKSLPQIARELNVDSLLEGTVLHSGNRIRITANFVQAVPERHLWAESYEFDRQDVLGVQGEVARSVADRIQIKVTPQEKARLASTRHVDPDAYQAYLLGRAYAVQPTAIGWIRAKEYLDKTIEKDPAYAPAYAALAELYIRARGSPVRTPSELRLQARRWAEKALTLDDTLAEAHTALARASQQEWDWVGAEREYRRAIALNPSYPIARIWYSMFLVAMGRFEESVWEAKRGQQLDPASPWVNTWAGAMYVYGGQTQEGMASLQKALELDPRYSDANIVRARTYITDGAHQQAVAELQQAVMLKKQREPLALGALAHAYARAGQREEALKLVAELEQIEREVEQEYVPPFGLIWAYAGLDDRDRAFAGLERAYELGSDRMIWLNVDPLLDPLRADPRFTDLVRRIGLIRR